LTLITVFRHVPPPIIGTCGVTHDRTCEAFEAELDWIEAGGAAIVERFDPATEPSEVDRRESVKKALLTEGDHCLPLLLADGRIVSRGVYLTRTQLARLVGVGLSRRQASSPAEG
jgi:hypothetical protein